MTAAQAAGAVERVLAALNAHDLDAFVACYAPDATIEDGEDTVAARGHDALFLERDVPWYLDNRDLTDYPHAAIRLYASLAELRRERAAAVRDTDAVIAGSCVPEGAAVGV